MKLSVKYSNQFYILFFYLFTVLDAKVFVNFLDTISMTHIVSSHTIFESSLMIFKCLPFSQKHLLRVKIFTLTLTCFIISLLIWIASCTIEFAFVNTWSMFYHCFNLISMSFVLFWTHIFVNKSSTELKLHLDLSKLIMKG